MDCVQYVLDKLQWQIKKEPLPDGWQHHKNFLIENVCKLITKKIITAKIHKIIFNIEYLLPNDIVFMKYTGRFIHHLAIYIGNQHIEHCLPMRGICKDLLHKKAFRFGVRIWELQKS